MYFADYTGVITSTEKKASSDALNKLLLSKHKKRDKLLHEDVGTVTDLDMNIIHEAFDVLFTQSIHIYNCVVRISKGRLSNILIIEFQFATTSVYKLVLYESTTTPSKKLSSEMVYLNNLPKWVLNAETFGNGDGTLLKLRIFDLKSGSAQEMVVQQGENKQYYVLKETSSDLLASEERFNLFRATYGIEESDIDFSTFKFRRLAEVHKGKLLLCRIV